MSKEYLNPRESDEMESLCENLGEWDGIRIDAYANGNMDTYRKARDMCELIEARICELEG